MCLALASIFGNKMARADERFTNTVGNFTCSAWLADQNSDARLTDDAWVEGFISDYELASSGRLNENLCLPVACQTMFAWLDHFCRSNGTLMMATAVDEFTDMNPFQPSGIYPDRCP
jgi:hypothetical protein